MKKLILGIFLSVIFVLSSHPVLADSEMFFIGNGIIKGVDVEDPAKITFDAFIQIFTDCYDIDGIDCEGLEPVGKININFHNTSVDEIDKGKFKSSYFTFLRVTYELDYTMVHIIAYGQFNGEDGWSIQATFRDYGEPGNVKASKGAPDLVFIRLRDQNIIPQVYSTAAFGDYGDGHFADLDGGDLIFLYQE